MENAVKIKRLFVLLVMVECILCANVGYFDFQNDLIPKTDCNPINTIIKSVEGTRDTLPKNGADISNVDPLPGSPTNASYLHFPNNTNHGGVQIGDFKLGTGQEALSMHIRPFQVPDGYYTILAKGFSTNDIARINTNTSQCGAFGVYAVVLRVDAGNYYIGLAGYLRGSRSGLSSVLPLFHLEADFAPLNVDQWNYVSIVSKNGKEAIFHVNDISGTRILTEHNLQQGPEVCTRVALIGDARFEDEKGTPVMLGCHGALPYSSVSPECFAGDIDELYFFSPDYPENRRAQLRAGAIVEPPTVEGVPSNITVFPPNTVDTALLVTTEVRSVVGGDILTLWDTSTGCNSVLLSLIELGKGSEVALFVITKNISSVLFTFSASDGVLCTKETMEMTLGNTEIAVIVNDTTQTAFIGEEFTISVSINGFPAPQKVELLKRNANGAFEVVNARKCSYPDCDQVSGRRAGFSDILTFSSVTASMAGTYRVDAFASETDALGIESELITIITTERPVDPDPLLTLGELIGVVFGSLGFSVVSFVILLCLVCCCCCFLIAVVVVVAVFILLIVAGVVVVLGGGGSGLLLKFVKGRRHRVVLFPPDFEPLMFGKYYNANAVTIPPGIATSHLDRLKALLLEPDKMLASAMVIVCGGREERDPLSKSLMYVLESEKEAKGFLEAVIVREVGEQTSPSTLFRQNSCASALFQVFAKMYGLQFLWDILAYPLYDIVHLGDDGDEDTGASLMSARLEVDPNKLELDDDLMSDTNVNSLQLWLIVQKLFGGICRNHKALPEEIRSILRAVRNNVYEQFPDMEFRSVGGFLFLRLICPSILTPCAYGLMEEMPLGDSMRRLVLVGKLMQNLANNTPPGTKETHMVRFNDFVRSNQDKLRVYLNNLLDEEGHQNDFTVPGVVLENSLRYLAGNIINFQTPLAAYLQANGASDNVLNFVTSIKM